MGKFIDITNERYGKLIVTKRAPNQRKRTRWYCNCDCGTKDFIACAVELRSGNTKSCGCLKTDKLKKFNKETKKKYNKYDLSGEYGIGYTSKNEEFYFDIEDYNKIKDYCWRIHNRGYVACSINMGKDEPKVDLMMHRIIMDCNNKEYEVDHVCGKDSRNDNRKSNLRICPHQKNMCNYTKPINNTSGVTGVSWDSTHNIWKSYITYNKNRINLGSYENKEEAITARLKAEKKYFKEFASQKYLYKEYGIEED